MSRSIVRRRARRFGGLLAALVLSAAAQSSLAATYTAADATQFTSLLNSTVLGDTIVLNAGTTYIGSFTLPYKSTGTGYLTIQSSAMGSLPPAGQRVFPANAPNMPKIQSSGANARAIKTATGGADGPHHYKLIGLEIIAPADNSTLTAVVDLGTSGTAQDTTAEIPHNIIIDRCIIRANSSTQTVRRGIALNSATTDIINSYIYDFKDASTDAQAIGGWNGPGPYNITNNYLEATAEAILFGGSTPTVPNLVPSDIMVNKNYFHKNSAWNGSSWLIKNHFELKSGQRVTLDGNVFQRSWNGAGGQAGKAITFKMVQSSGQGAAWSVTQDVTITNNRIFDCGIGIAFGGNVGTDGNGFNGYPRNFTIRNNLWYNVTNTMGQGFLIQIGQSPQNINFDHNTGFCTNMICSLDGPALTGFTYTNNVNNHATYGFKGTGTGVGRATFNTWLPTMTWGKNVIQGASTSNYLPEWAGGWELAPFNNANLGYPSAWTTVLQNQATPGTDFSGYKVLGWNQPTNTGTYPYNNTGTDGKDIGCDIDQLNTATAGCITGVWSSPPVTVTFKNGVNGYNGSTSFMASGGNPTTWNGPARYHSDSNRHSPTSQYVLRSFYKFDVSSIPAGKTIDSATLKIKMENAPGSNVFLNAYRVAPVSGAFTVNYGAATRNSPLGNATTWTGGLNAAGNVTDSNNDFVDTPDDSEPVSAIGWYNLDVKSSVQAWVNGTPNNGWILMPNPTTPNVVIYMSTPADSHGSSEYPELEVTYH